MCSTEKEKLQPVAQKSKKPTVQPREAAIGWPKQRSVAETCVMRWKTRKQCWITPREKCRSGRRWHPRDQTTTPWHLRHTSPTHAAGQVAARRADEATDPVPSRRDTPKKFYRGKVNTAKDTVYLPPSPRLLLGPVLPARLPRGRSRRRCPGQAISKARRQGLTRHTERERGQESERASGREYIMAVHPTCGG